MTAFRRNRGSEKMSSEYAVLYNADMPADGIGVVKLDDGELACRMAEEMLGIKRPAGMKSSQALRNMLPGGELQTFLE
jgi:hypothetical protein